MLRTGAASHTPQTHIKLNYCSLFSRGTVYAQLRFLCLRSVFLKLSHTDYEMCFCCPALTFPVLLLSGLPYWVYLVREILDIRELMGLLWTNKGQDTKRNVMPLGERSLWLTSLPLIGPCLNANSVQLCLSLAFTLQLD